jgi:PRC-barrel domain protein
MTTTEDLQNMEGQTAVDMNGAKLGKIGQIYVDDQTGQPLWVTITTGMFGTKQSFAPLHGSRSDGGDLHLAVTKDMVTAPPASRPTATSRTPRTRPCTPTTAGTSTAPPRTRAPGVRGGHPRRRGRP